jgi:hypothetical protein
MSASIAIGVDIDASMYAIGLREGRGATHHLRFVNRAPLRTSRDSKAAPEAELFTAAAFWSARHRDLTAYLGGFALGSVPISIVLPPSLDANGIVKAQSAARQAGFGQVSVIGRTDAVAARWLHEAGGAREASALTALYVGSTTVEGRAYGLRHRARAESRLEPRDTILVAHSPANDALVAHLSDLVRSLVPGSPLPDEERALSEAAYDFGCALGETSLTEGRLWQGPLAERLTLPLVISADDAATWPVSQLLARAIDRVLTGTLLDGNPIVVGGVGGAWPIVRGAIRRAAPNARPWISSYPRNDVALGAALWPVVGGDASGDSGGRTARSSRDRQESAADDVPGNGGAGRSRMPDGQAPRPPINRPPSER